jgi:aspartate/methionine/tyrosine aminotransferase
VSLAALAREVPDALVLASSGFAHGYGMAGARLGALAGPPEVIRACLQVKIAAVRLNTSSVAHAGARAAIADPEWLVRGEEIIRRNLEALAEFAQPIVRPDYGYSCVLEVGELGVSAQELTVALCRRKVAVYPGDGLGEVGALSTIRINLSDPEPAAIARLRQVWSDALHEARSGVYRDGVRDFFLRAGTERGRRFAQQLDDFSRHGVPRSETIQR